MKVKYAKLKPNDTKTDQRTQRGLDKRRVERMSRAYDPKLVGVPVVSKRSSGVYNRIDGQHRLAANILAGFGDVPILMEVHEGLSVQEEADLFLRIDSERTAIRAFDRYMIRLTAGEPGALDIQSILKRVGYQITKHSSRKGIMAVSAVERAHNHGVLDGVVRVLDGWLDGDPAAFDVMIIDAFAAFLRVFPDADLNHLSSRLENFAPEKFMARLRRERQQLAVSKPNAARFVIVDIYNFKTPKAKRLLCQEMPTTRAGIVRGDEDV